LKGLLHLGRHRNETADGSAASTGRHGLVGASGTTPVADTNKPFSMCHTLRQSNFLANIFYSSKRTSNRARCHSPWT
jgi:hypothetical protein